MGDMTEEDWRRRALDAERKLSELRKHYDFRMREMEAQIKHLLDPLVRAAAMQPSPPIVLTPEQAKVFRETNQTEPGREE